MNRLEELKDKERIILECRESCNMTKRALSKQLYSVRAMIRFEENKTN